ncbi:MAG: TraR/DksA C4-type zinc finger protein [Patescibacteria group bacterium]|nr:TraR/DksA C4-type zinc finger protein [Patescibacteria group bacterium]
MTLDTKNFEEEEKLRVEKQEIETSLSKIGYKLENGRWLPKPIEDETDIEFRDEVADEIEDMEERQATESALVKRLKNIDLALEKIDQGTYGKCEVSDQDIEEDRLQANPAARTCTQHLDKEDTLK